MNVTDLKKTYGRSIKPRELAEFLGVDPRTVVKYADRWGGVQVAPGTYRFFENRIKEVLDAQQNKEKRCMEVQGICDSRRRDQTEAVPGCIEEVVSGGCSLGKGNKQASPREKFRDSHGVFEGQ